MHAGATPLWPARPLHCRPVAPARACFRPRLTRCALELKSLQHCEATRQDPPCLCNTVTGTSSPPRKCSEVVTNQALHPHALAASACSLYRCIHTSAPPSTNLPSAITHSWSGGPLRHVSHSPGLTNIAPEQPSQTAIVDAHTRTLGTLQGAMMVHTIHPGPALCRHTTSSGETKVSCVS